MFSTCIYARFGPALLARGDVFKNKIYLCGYECAKKGKEVAGKRSGEKRMKLRGHRKKNVKEGTRERAANEKLCDFNIF